MVTEEENVEKLDILSHANKVCQEPSLSISRTTSSQSKVVPRLTSLCQVGGTWQPTSDGRRLVGRMVLKKLSPHHRDLRYLT